MKMYVFCFVLLGLAVITGCASGKPAGGGGGPHLNRHWMLKKMEGFSREELLKAGAYIDLSTLEQTSAKAGCNTLRFATTAKARNSISFTGIMATKMYCQPFMKLETALIGALKQVVSYELTGHFAKFKDRSGKVLIEAVAADWD